MADTPPLNFTTTDKLDRKPFCDRLERLLMEEHVHVDGSLVVALDGGFGSGKTTFLEMWKNDLLSRRNKSELFRPMPVILNAWESDYCGDPLVAIIASLLNAIDEWKGADAPDNKAKLKEAANDMAWFALSLANDVAAKATGLNLMKASEDAEKKKATRNPGHPDFIKLYNQRKSALDTLKTNLETAFKGETPKVLVFVDELDRCRPDYAIHYLETIKHVFNVKGMVFVLAVDYSQLTSSAKSLFGEGLVPDEYFRKFWHRRFSLPKPESYESITEDYVKRYLSIEGKRLSRLALKKGDVQRITELANAFKLRPRQFQEAFRIVGHTLATTDANKEGQLLWAIGAGTLLMSFLRIANFSLFEMILVGQPVHSEICELLVSTLGKDDAELWIGVLLSGSQQHDSSYAWISQIMKQHDYTDWDEANVRIKLHSFFAGWGSRPNRIREICKMIEDADCL